MLQSLELWAFSSKYLTKLVLIALLFAKSLSSLHQPWSEGYGHNISAKFDNMMDCPSHSAVTALNFNDFIKVAVQHSYLARLYPIHPRLPQSIRSYGPWIAKNSPNYHCSLPYLVICSALWLIKFSLPVIWIIFSLITITVLITPSLYCTLWKLVSKLLTVLFWFSCH